MKRSLKLWIALALLAAASVAAAGYKAYRYFAPYPAAERIAAAAQPGDIMMYSYTTCGVCRKAKRWFSFHGVPYEECYADLDAACNARLKALKTRGTPTFEINGHVLRGFEPERIAAALERPAGAGDPHQRALP